MGEPDLAEEVIREYGYEHIVPTFLKDATVTGGGLDAEQRRRAKAKRVLCAQGFYEAETMSFYADADLDALHIAADAPERKVIRLLNPISSNLTIMRTLLAPSLLNAAVTNLKNGNASGRLFELSNIYLPKQLPVTELPEERLHLGFVAWGEDEDFFRVKGAVEALAEQFGLTFDYQRADDTPGCTPASRPASSARGSASAASASWPTTSPPSSSCPRTARTTRTSTWARSTTLPSRRWPTPTCATSPSRSSMWSAATWPWWPTRP